ncbi:UNVERIFIED_ORG: plastocyanin [Burkholderia sp. 1263]
MSWHAANLRRRGGPRIGPAWLAGALLASACFAAAVDASASPRTYVVSIEGMRFDPPMLTVHRGDKVVWTNRDPFPHTVSASSHAFDSRSIAANASWTHVVRRSGSYPYLCRFHPTMQGTLTVQ